MGRVLTRASNGGLLKRITIHDNGSTSVSANEFHVACLGVLANFGGARRLNLRFGHRLASFVRGGDPVVHFLRRSLLVLRYTNGQANFVARRFAFRRLLTRQEAIGHCGVLPYALAAMVSNLNGCLLAHTHFSDRRCEGVDP